MGEERTKNVANGVVPFRHGSRSLEINPWQSSSGTATNINPWLSSIEAAANINSWQLSFEAEPPQSDGHHLTSQFAWARKNKLMISSNSLVCFKLLLQFLNYCVSYKSVFIDFVFHFYNKT